MTDRERDGQTDKYIGNYRLLKRILIKVTIEMTKVDCLSELSHSFGDNKS